jgi:hypothetical protein
MRFCEAGSIQDAVKSAYIAAGGVTKVSDYLGVLTSVLSYGTEMREDRPGGLGVNYLDRLGRMNPEAARVLAQHFAALAGGVFRPVEADGGKSLSDLCAELAKEGGEALAATMRAMQSAKVRDYAEALREMDESIEAGSRTRALIAEEMAAAKAIPLRGVVK